MKGGFHTNKTLSGICEIGLEFLKVESKLLYKSIGQISWIRMCAAILTSA